MEYPLLQLLVILVIMALDLGYAIWDTYSTTETAVSSPLFPQLRTNMNVMHLTVLLNLT